MKWLGGDNALNIVGFFNYNNPSRLMPAKRETFLEDTLNGGGLDELKDILPPEEIKKKKGTDKPGDTTAKGKEKFDVPDAFLITKNNT